MRELSLRDQGLASEISSLGWVSDGLDILERLALSSLLETAMADAEAGRRAARSATLLDGVADDERLGLEGLAAIASRDPGLAAAVTATVWFADRWGDHEWQTLVHVASLASADLESSRAIADFPWFCDGITREEGNLITSLALLASRSSELAGVVPELAWVVDGVSSNEWEVIHRIAHGSHELETARAVLELPGSADLRNGLLRALDLGSKVRQELAGRPWFEDGLTREEVTRVAALGRITADGDGDLRAALLGQPHAQFATASLPLTGAVNISVYQTTPFGPGDEIAAAVREMVGHIEAFAGAPLPTTEILVLVRVVPEGSIYGGYHRSDYLVVNRRLSDGLERTQHVLIHELTHYYHYEPRWLAESVAHLMEGYVGDRMGIRRLDEYRREAAERVARDCSTDDVSTLRHALFMDEFRGRSLSSCTRAVGTNFLHHLLEVMGERSLAAALRELRPLAGPSPEVDEEVIFSTLLGHTPDGRRERFREVYRRLHGAPYADPGVHPPDDHGNSAATATAIEVGETTAAVLDYRFDVDSFLFRAAENRKYRLELHHEDLRHSSVQLFPAGEGTAGLQFRREAPSGPVIVWVAPSTGWYEVAVTNWRNTASPYALRIAVVADTADDHGDSVATATDLGGGELVPGEGDGPPYLHVEVAGTIDSASDLDYFRFSLVPGKSYYLNIDSSGPTHCCVSLTGPELTVADEASNRVLFGWAERELVVVVHGRPEHVGPYTLSLTGHDD